jgi:hypothetical protein
MWVLQMLQQTLPLLLALLLGVRLPRSQVWTLLVAPPQQLAPRRAL